MSRYLDDFSEDNIIQVLRAYLAFSEYSELLISAIHKVEEFNELELLANKALRNNNRNIFEKKAITEIERTTKQRIGQSVLR